MLTIKDILARNHTWSEQVRRDDPDYFSRAAAAQAPEVLWIGCSDSRVGPDSLVSLPMGSIFVHRNIANIFATNDLNCLAVLEYAVDELHIPNIVVCGHYRCGGIHAAMQHSGIQPIDLWLDQVRYVYHRHTLELDHLDEEQRWRRLAELNVESQVHNIARNTIIREAWRRGQEVNIIGVIYDIHDGLLHQTGVQFSSYEEWQATQARG